MKDKKGSIAIECAIAFSICLVLLLSVFTIMNIHNQDMIVYQAVEQSSEDMAIYMPFTVSASDAFSNAVNFLPDSLINGNNYNQISTIYNLLSQCIDISGNTVEDLILNGLFADIYRDDVLEYYYSYDKNSLTQDIEIDTVNFEYSEEDNVIVVHVYYSYSTIIGKIDREAYSVIPFYGNVETNFRFCEDDDDPSENESTSAAEDVWSMNNFARGLYFQTEYGANLPSTFPVLSGYSDGVATGIVSIDTTSPYYSNERNIVNRITEEIDELSAFDGASVNISGNNYTVDGEDINRRDLIIVIPENSPQENTDIIYGLEDYAAANNVNIVLQQNGTSLKYA